jgi:hypothetical protein
MHLICLRYLRYRVYQHEEGHTHTPCTKSSISWRRLQSLLALDVPKSVVRIAQSMNLDLEA